MEVTSTLSNTFKRLTIPRSTSSIGSFTTSNGIATNIEQKFQESTPPQLTHAPPSNGHSSSNHKHPPLSYVQHMRQAQHHSQQNLSLSSDQQQQQKYHLPTRPLSGDISSFMIRSASTDFHSLNEYTPEENEVVHFLIILFISSLEFFRRMYPRKHLRSINHLFNVI